MTMLRDDVRGGGFLELVFFDDVRGAGGVA